MTSQNPKKQYFKPKKPINQMTEEELDEFAKFIFDNLIGDTGNDERKDDKSC